MGALDGLFTPDGRVRSDDQQPSFPTTSSLSDRLWLNKPQSQPARPDNGSATIGVPQTRPDARIQTPEVDTRGSFSTNTPERYQPGDSLATVQNGTLKLKFGDKNIDAALGAEKFSTIDVTHPQGMEVRYWLDDKGFYFWFRDGSTGKFADSAQHHIPQAAKQICINGETFDLEALRLKTAENFANTGAGRDLIGGNGNPNGIVQSTRMRPYFENISKQLAYDPRHVVQYADRLSTLPGGALATEQRFLEDSARNSPNPYMRIYLADIYVAEAVKPRIEQYKAYGRIDPRNPQTLERLKMAEDLLKGVVNDSRVGLRRIKQTPMGNVMSPHDPYEIYTNPQGGYYGLWAGSYDQANQRQAAIRMLQNMVNSNSISSVLQTTELLPRR